MAFVPSAETFGRFMCLRIIGFAVDATLWLIPPVDNLAVRIGLLVVSVVGNALAGVVVGAIALATVALVTSVRRALAR